MKGRLLNVLKSFRQLNSKYSHKSLFLGLQLSELLLGFVVKVLVCLPALLRLLQLVLQLVDLANMLFLLRLHLSVLFFHLSLQFFQQLLNLAYVVVALFSFKLGPIPLLLCAFVLADRVLLVYSLAL